MPSRRQAALIRSIAIAVGGAVAIGLGASAIAWAILGHDAQALAPWLALAKAASVAWVAAVGWRVSWRRLDEMEQETRKTSWFIGSTTAILITAPAVVFWLVGGGSGLEHLLGRRSTPGALFALGWGVLVLAQLLSTGVARIAQRLVKR